MNGKYKKKKNQLAKHGCLLLLSHRNLVSQKYPQRGGCCALGAVEESSLVQEDDQMCLVLCELTMVCWWNDLGRCSIWKIVSNFGAWSPWVSVFDVPAECDNYRKLKEWTVECTWWSPALACSSVIALPCWVWFSFPYKFSFSCRWYFHIKCLCLLSTWNALTCGSYWYKK